MDSSNVGVGQVVTLGEWCKINKVKKSLAYEMSRRNAIPGMFRIGRQIRVDIECFRKSVQSNTVFSQSKSTNLSRS
jgi:hypothetical protein